MRWQKMRWLMVSEMVIDDMVNQIISGLCDVKGERQIKEDEMMVSEMVIDDMVNQIISGLCDVKGCEMRDETWQMRWLMRHCRRI